MSTYLFHDFRLFALVPGDLFIVSLSYENIMLQKHTTSLSRNNHSILKGFRYEMSLKKL